MFDSEERERRAALIIMTLVKFYVVIELSMEGCPLCRKALEHDEECPVSLAWSFLDREQQEEARRSFRALALSMGQAGEQADERTDTLIH